MTRRPADVTDALDQLDAARTAADLVAASDRLGDALDARAEAAAAAIAAGHDDQLASAGLTRAARDHARASRRHAHEAGHLVDLADQLDPWNRPDGADPSNRPPGA